MNYERFRLDSARPVNLTDFDPASKLSFENRQTAERQLALDIERLCAVQDVLNAASTYAMLIVLQGLDAAGKDGIIKHVMSGVNPQGVDVFSFKAPSSEELSHDFLWRISKALPARGRISMLNRSHYEEVLAVRVEPALLARQRLPPERQTPTLWNERYDDINAFERHLVRSGTVVLKFFLHVSKEEQRKRLLARIEQPEKHWKLSPQDVSAHQAYDEYSRAYEAMLERTSTPEAPWYIVPADRKWVARTAVGNVIVEALESLKLTYPTVDPQSEKALESARAQLEGSVSARAV